MDRVRGLRDHDGVTRSQENPGEVRQTFLGSDRGDGFGLRVQLDAPGPLVVITDGGAQLGDPLRSGVAMVARVVRCLLELVDDRVRGRDIGIAHAEVDDVFALAPRAHLQVVDDREDVRRETVDAPEVHPQKLQGPRREVVRRDLVILTATPEELRVWGAVSRWGRLGPASRRRVARAPTPRVRGRGSPPGSARSRHCRPRATGPSGGRRSPWPRHRPT